MRILVIEDEKKIAELIEARLKKEKYQVDISFDGEDGLYNALNDIYDLILLDVMLPKMNGFEILKKIKDNNIKAEVIMLTARSSIEDKLEGFDIGADDYLTKPFHMEELVARVNARLRKDSKNKNILEYEDLKLDISKYFYNIDHIVLLNMIKDDLTNDEYKLYRLIYARTLSSLMAPAKTENTTIILNNNDYLFKVTGQVVTFDGYLKVYKDYEDSKDVELPLLKEKENIFL